ncbi:mannose-1-phosphate guanylyltransferase/mannose-6-phosphate isomerase [Pseudoalteromonas sp. MMG005]|uniref:mannose-1-phosphate guanylyltransferase/mannose-6-phosphate isomerase n=1 Tax=Pseudoalteromonas sp. MMG005 TaxID=2822682 RepID=UPI001B39F1EC|nr:mannose-1-phosphate guanylyltransferase/mannose-6-phosphate isomerase [Pseudoalteromonas sp. MMG005]MBQ4844370.1 mannose-1-phosphate guanylyltransferase/mannose-6-phosphate isomerase [Pseudoalteromonas sp. MMG005]
MHHDEKILPVIMAGGSGKRLWPLSRENYPKQFLSLDNSQNSMLQQTICRLNGIAHEPPLIICNEEHRFIAAEQLRQLDKKLGGIFLEPEGRNTAPAIALAAFQAIENSNDPLLLILAADHVIGDIDAFQHSIHAGIEHAALGKLVVFGVDANTPETGYGYIKRGAQCGSGYIVEHFVEKPSREVAEQYLLSGEYCWNSGMFLFRASRYLDALNEYRPDIFEACKKATEVQELDLDFIRINKSAFMACPNESIDYAVMEHTPDAVMVPMNAKWNDVGGFEALWKISEKDNSGNVFAGDVYHVDCENSFIHTDSKLVVAAGVKDLIIVSTKDSILVTNKSCVQEIGSIVQALKKNAREEVKYHREVYRPWGKYDLIDVGERFQVKRITVKPGAKLSKQMHHHRAEHWIVVSGTAKVTIDGKERFLTENESVYIPITAVHVLENPGKVGLELIEVQSGSYLKEDDIVRFEDKYGRK